MNFFAPFYAGENGQRIAWPEPVGRVIMAKRNAGIAGSADGTIEIGCGVPGGLGFYSAPAQDSASGCVLGCHHTPCGLWFVAGVGVLRLVAAPAGAGSSRGVGVLR